MSALVSWAGLAPPTTAGGMGERIDENHLVRLDC